jgi:hypothetical protein
MIQQEERWHKCEVPYTRYEVSNQGRVRNAHTGQVLRPRKVSRGYRKVTLFYKGQQKHCLVHNLVATAFVEGWREGLEVNHKNGVKTDNRAENLEWVTSSENKQHARDVLLIDVKPVALLDERGHLQYVFNSASACSRMMGGRVRNQIRMKHRFHGFRPLYISVPMYREIVHLVAVHHYTLHSAWVEAWAQSAVESPSGGSKRDARSMQQSCGSNGNQSTMQPAVGADYLPQPLRKEGSKTVCPNNTQPAAQTGKGNHNY